MAKRDGVNMYVPREVKGDIHRIRDDARKNGMFISLKQAMILWSEKAKRVTMTWDEAAQILNKRFSV